MDHNNLNELFIRVFSAKDIRFFALKRRKYQWDKYGNPVLMMEFKDRINVYTERITKGNKQFVSNLLLIFTLYDGWLENKYSLIEGDSFKSHYDGLPYSTSEERIQKDCYRILKILRNTIQHNPSVLVLDEDNNVSLSYSYRNTDFKLSISNKGMELLFGLVRYIILGANKEHLTYGHYLATIAMMYKEMIGDITIISDEFGNCIEDSVSNDIVRFQCHIRYLFIKCDYELIGNSVIKMCHYDEYDNCKNKAISYNRIDYTVEYMNKSYVLPEEIGKITNKVNGSFILFDVSQLTNTWEKI